MTASRVVYAPELEDRVASTVAFEAYGSSSRTLRRTPYAFKGMRVSPKGEYAAIFERHDGEEVVRLSFESKERPEWTGKVSIGGKVFPFRVVFEKVEGILVFVDTSGPYVGRFLKELACA